MQVHLENAVYATALSVTDWVHFLFISVNQTSASQTYSPDTLQLISLDRQQWVLAAYLALSAPVLHSTLINDKAKRNYHCL